ncbi:MAG TPA: hypothetical protein ENH32_01345 [Proteobacteria bacterium]|nr:hypothetical protein BMS3Abin14_00491 [bacterium BMS3Abin14]HDL52599.1 hypothetical protein [Pseudomonadota bacterium]
MSEHFFVKENPSIDDPGAVTRELDRRAKYLQLLHGLDYDKAIEAVFLSDKVLQAKYSALGSPPVIQVRKSGEAAPGIGHPTLEPE